MLFKKADLNDLDALNNVLKSQDALSCENTPANIIMWADVYDTEFCIENGVYYQKFGQNSSEIFSLPIGTDIKSGVERIKSYCSEKGLLPKFWAAEGKQLEEFKRHYQNEYDIYEAKDSFEYIYNQTDLAELKGKKYHSKRNFISSFSKKYNWTYEEINKANKGEALLLAEEWYSKNEEKHTDTLLAEKNAIKILIDNFESFSAVGGLLKVEGRTVAFAVATKISEGCYDVNFEKALPEFSAAYTVINNELSKRLNCDFINREDDLGLEGLRKAKQSYHPAILLKKYICMPKWVREEAIKLHLSAFAGDSRQDAELIFQRLYPQNYYYRLNGEKLVSQMFVIEGGYSVYSAGYIYAAATALESRGQGNMSSLIKETKGEFDILFLKPANDRLYEFYSKIGFKTRFKAAAINGSRCDEKGSIKTVLIENVEQFNAVRNYLLPENCIKMGGDACTFALQLYTAVCDDLENPKFMALYYLDNGRLIISELLYNNKSYTEFIDAVCHRENVITYTARIPEFAESDGMILCDKEIDNELPEQLYLGITFD